MTPRAMDGTHAELVRMVRQARARWRGRLALRAAATIAAAVLVAFVLAALAIQRLDFAPWALVVARAAGALLVIGAAAWAARPVFRPVTDERVALYVEEHEPTLRAALISALETRADAISPALSRRVVEEAIERARAVEHGRRIERRPIRRTAAMAAGVVLAGIALVAISPAFVTHSARMLFLPAPTQAAPAAVRLEVTPGTASVPRGADQAVTVRVHGMEAAEVAILVQGPADSAFQRIPMILDERDGSWRISLFDVDGTTRYLVDAGGVRSPIYRLDVVDLPYVGRMALELHFPAYTGLPPRTIEDGGDVAAVAGTVVRLRAHPTAAVAGGRIVLDDGSALPLRAEEGTLAGDFRIRRTGYYQVELTAAGGETVIGSPQYLIDVLPDEPPTLSISQPGRDVKVTAVDEVFVEATSADDFGVAAVELVYSVNGGPQTTVPLFGGRPMTEVAAGHTLYLEEMGLQPGDFVSYFARARDAAPQNAGTPTVSDIYFMEIRPFGREYRQAEERGQQGGQGGEGGDGEGGIDGELSQRQREVIAATFNLVRDRSKYTADEVDEHMVTLTLAQERLREQVETLVQRMKNRGVVRDSAFQVIVETLPKAAAEMRAAAGRLRAGAPADALPPEQRALRHLQHAEAVYREVQVSMGQQSGGGGGQGGTPSAEDLADLFGLELDKLRNQYETVQRGEREQTQRGLDEAAERLRDLARRQEQENQRLKDELARREQRAGADGSGQRRLADETEETARQLERLAREQSSPALMDAARRLTDAASSMRRSAAGGQQGGTGEGSAALERLREAERRLQRQRSAGVQEEIRDAERRAQRLADEQDQLRQGMRELPNAGQARAQRARELAERKDRQAAEVGDLHRDLDRLAAESREESPEAARELREAAGSIRENRIEERIRQSRLGTQANAPPEWVERGEEQIARGLDELRERLRAADETAGRAEGERPDRALERARNLARSLESLQERTRAAREAAQRGDPAQPGEQGQEGQPGQPGQEGQPGEPGEGEGTAGGAPGGEERRGGMARAGGGGGGANLAPDAVRQFRGEVRQRLEEARDLRRRLADQGRDTEEIDELIAGLRRLDDARVFADAEELAFLQAALVDRVKRMEFALRLAVEGTDPDRVLLSGAADVPPGYRELVERYYRALAERNR